MPGSARRLRAGARRARLMAAMSRFWLADFKLSRRGLIWRKTGRRIGLDVITPGEVLKWWSYYLFVRMRRWRRGPAPGAARLWFAPEQPRPWYVIWAAAIWAGLHIARSEAEADLVFYFEDSTRPAAPPPAGAINAGCADITKSRVARVFGQVAGYPLSLDPMAHHGAAVEKGEENGAHDGRIVACPTPALIGKNYERLIDATEGETAIDLRTSIVGGRPAAVVIKTKPAAKRFSIHNATVRFAAVEDVFSAAEIDLIARFSAAMRLDWGALDVLRDRANGRIYIVDVNKTDTGPAVDLSWPDRVRLTRALAEALGAFIAERSATPRAEAASAML